MSNYFPLNFVSELTNSLWFGQEFPLSGWQLVHKANETETIYKFHRSLKVAPGASVTVWSAGKRPWLDYLFLFVKQRIDSMISLGVFFSFFQYLKTGTGVSHEPPSTLVMKEQRWFVADQMSTLLLNSDGEVSVIIHLYSPLSV